jgi:hypothetical protein
MKITCHNSSKVYGFEMSAYVVWVVPEMIHLAPRKFLLSGEDREKNLFLIKLSILVRLKGVGGKLPISSGWKVWINVFGIDPSIHNRGTSTRHN